MQRLVPPLALHKQGDPSSSPCAHTRSQQCFFFEPPTTQRPGLPSRRYTTFFSAMDADTGASGRETAAVAPASSPVCTPSSSTSCVSSSQPMARGVVGHGMHAASPRCWPKAAAIDGTGQVLQAAECTCGCLANAMGSVENVMSVPRLLASTLALCIPAETAAVTVAATRSEVVTGVACGADSTGVPMTSDCVASLLLLILSLVAS
eukprot:3965965-Prymnesium_polylepis.1